MTEQAASLLRERYAKTKTEDLARELGVCYRTVCRWARELHLRKSKVFLRRCSKAAGSKERGPNTMRNGRLDEKTEKFLVENHQKMTDRQLARHFGVNDKTVRLWSARLSLKRTRRARPAGAAPEGHTAAAEKQQREQMIRDTVERLYPDGGDVEIVRLTGYRKGSISGLAKKYGIVRSEQYLRCLKEKRRSNMEKARGKRTSRKEDLKQAILSGYGTMPNRDLAARLGITRRYLYDIMDELSLPRPRRKSERAQARAAAYKRKRH